MRVLSTIPMMLVFWSCGQITGKRPAQGSPTGQPTEPQAGRVEPPVLVECDLASRPALRVRVHDAVTGADITRWSKAVARDGDFVDSTTSNMRIPPELNFGPLRLPLAYDRAGSYAMVVRRPGYDSWRRAGIQALLNRHGCLESVDLSARLTPVRGLARRAVPVIVGPVVTIDSGGGGRRFLVQEGQWVDAVLPTSSRLWLELHPLTRVRDGAGRDIAAHAVRGGEFLHVWITAAVPHADSGRVFVDSLVVTPPL